MESVSRPTLNNIFETTILATAEISMTPTPQPIVSIGSGCASFLAASRIIQIAATKISSASMVPEMFSIFPCPKGCLLSAGMLDVLTENSAMMAASRSTPE